MVVASFHASFSLKEDMRTEKASLLVKFFAPNLSADGSLFDRSSLLAFEGSGQLLIWA